MREELEARQIEIKGVKNVLMQRLQEAIDKEKAEAKEAGVEENVPQQQMQKPVENSGKMVADEEKKKPEKEKESIVVQIKEEIIELMETDEVVCADYLIKLNKTRDPRNF